MIDPNNHVISKSLFAGMSIGIAGYIYLSTNAILGTILFSVGLL